MDSTLSCIANRNGLDLSRYSNIGSIDDRLGCSWFGINGLREKDKGRAVTSLIILFGAFFLALFIGVPIVFSLAIAALGMLWQMDMFVPELVIQQMYSGADSFPMMAIPFFMLAGAFMDTGGISVRLVRFSNVLVGWISGGLAHVSIMASIFFAGISGSAVADTTAIGSTLIPMMTRRKFDPEFAAAVVAAGGVIGPIIPPSIPMILYGAIAGQSIGQLFLGGIVPGLLMGIGLMVLIYFMAKKRGYPCEIVDLSFSTLLKTTTEASGALVMPLIIVGGILGGAFTATEAAVVAAVYAFVLGMFVYRELTWKALPDLIFQAGMNTGMILIIVGVANLIGFILAAEQIPLALADWFQVTFVSKTMVLMVINAALLFVGCFIDGGSAMIIFAPVLVPVILKFGIDPIFFGVIMTVNLMIGTITPPVGLSLYIAGGIAKVPLAKLSRAIVPFLLIEAAVLMLITYVPELVLYLPRLFGK